MEVVAFNSLEKKASTFQDPSMQSNISMSKTPVIGAEIRDVRQLLGCVDNFLSILDDYWNPSEGLGSGNLKCRKCENVTVSRMLVQPLAKPPPDASDG